MKKTPLLRSILIAGCSVCSMCLISCKKEAVSTPQPATVNTAPVNAVQSSTLGNVKLPFGIVGRYFNRGSRTLYKGKADNNIAMLSLDYYNKKKVVPLLDDKSLVCGYGETNFVNQGWKYLIRYNLQKGEITLAPNNVMAAAIQPNSFETRFTSYDAATKTFHFLTRFTDQNGNENEVFDILTKE